MASCDNNRSIGWKKKGLQEIGRKEKERMKEKKIHNCTKEERKRGKRRKEIKKGGKK